MKIFSIVCACAFMAAFPALANDTCQLTELASLPMTETDSGKFTVPVVVQGKTYKFLVKTNQMLSLVSENLVSALKLNREHIPTGRGEEIASVNGPAPTEQVHVPDIGIGAIHIASGAMIVAGDIGDISGVLGADFLRKFDLEFDFKAAKLNLFSQDHCKGQGVYWSDTAAVLPMHLDSLGGMSIEAELDNHELKASVSPIGHSSLGVDQAKVSFGLDASSPGVTPADQDGYYRYTFKSLTMGGLTVSNVPITLNPHMKICPADLDCYGQTQLVLGHDVLKKLRVFIAFKERTLYITPADAHR